MKTLVERLRELSATWRAEADRWDAAFPPSKRPHQVASTLRRNVNELNAILTAAGQEGVHITWDVDGNRIVTPRGQEGAAPIDNGNTFVFCDFVSDRMGCLRL